MQKLIFLDLDGTLVNSNGVITPKSHEAIKNARINGHRIFICTGRSENEVFNDVLSVGFDGMIYSNGAHVIADNKVIFQSVFQLEEMIEVNAFMQQHDIVYSVQNKAGLSASKEYIAAFEKIAESKSAKIADEEQAIAFQQHVINVRQALHYSPELVQENVSNISFIAKNQQGVDLLVERYQKKFEVYQNVVPIFGECSGEIGMKGITKGLGIQKIADYYQVDIQNTVGIGDGVNDLPMFQKVALSISMGNASDFVKQHSTITTKSITEDGLYWAFKDIGVI